MNDIKDFFAASGCKMTKQRKAILEILMDSRTCLSAEEIFIKAKNINPNICLTTVYRTIELLASYRMLNKIDIGDNKYRYEINSNTHYHHIICMGCKKMFKVQGCPVPDFESSIRAQTKFKIIGHRLEVYGYCPECQGTV
ncbi:MAG: transcriptional repressor [Clostridiaceae bacterium]|nr:transcriptional repressor [Clostridiaceae bacterium]